MQGGEFVIENTQTDVTPAIEKKRIRSRQTEVALLMAKVADAESELLDVYNALPCRDEPVDAETANTLRYAAAGLHNLETDLTEFANELDGISKTVMTED
jgi:hypothetical protein